MITFEGLERALDLILNFITNKVNFITINYHL